MSETPHNPVIPAELSSEKFHGIGRLPLAVSGAIPGSRPEIDCTNMDALLGPLTAEGEKIDYIVVDNFDNKELLESLEASLGQDTLEYIRHSMRYANIPPESLYGPTLLIPATDEIVDARGEKWPEETGPLIDLDKVRLAGADPSHVIYFRVTQPGTVAKPERFWTTDFAEVKGGLSVELGSQAKTAIILVSTLEEVAKNGGLIRDINDDCGIAVRQVGAGAFHQSEAITTLARE